jgi:transposase
VINAIKFAIEEIEASDQYFDHTRLKDWRRIHTRYDRCAHTFMSAICIAAAVTFWL